MHRPKPLKKGDCLALIATSGIVDNTRIEAAVKAITNLGFNVHLGKTVTASERFLAGSDALRASELNEMFSRTDIDGIFVMRGGYGANRILHLLDFEMIAKNPKFFGGYSDVTALHMAINQRCGFITYHTPMPSTELYKGVDTYTQEMLDRVLFDFGNSEKIENPRGIRIETLYSGVSRGILTGGNLSLVVDSLGTDYEIDTKGKILLLEDIGEEPYRIDSMLWQLKAAKKFSDANGIILGGFTNCGEKPELLNIFKDIILPHKKPTIYNVSVGHMLPTMSLPLGRRILLNAFKGEFFCEE